MDADRESLEQAHRRLQHLYEISKVLMRFGTVEHAVPEAIAVVAQELPLRSAIFISDVVGMPRTMVWQAEGESEGTLRAATAHAAKAYAYLVRSGVDLECGGGRVLDLPARRAIEPATTEAESHFVVLPLVVERGPIFGALQIHSAERLDEPALMFVDSVVNQLANALQRYAAEQAVRTSEAKLAGIISISADAIVSIDGSLRIVMYNEGAQEIFGWRRDEIVGQPLEILIPERFRQIHREHVRRFAEEETRARKMAARLPVLLGLRKNGEEFPAEAAISKLSVGGARLFTVVLRDVTEQKRFEQEAAVLAEVGAVFAATLDHEQTLANIARLVLRELADFCCIEFADEHGELRRLAVVTSDPAKAEIAEALKRFPLDRTRPHLSWAILRSGRPEVVAEVSAETIRKISQNDEHRRLLEAIDPRSMMGVPIIVGGESVGALVVASCRPDRRYRATDLRLLEEMARRAALALEHARLYRTAGRAVQTRDDVLGIVAHDLRSPLNAITMQAALIERSGAGTADNSSRAAQAIRRAVTRMDRLIQDLLDVTRLDAGHLAIEPRHVRAGEFVRQWVEAQKPPASEGAPELRLDVAPGLPEILADEARLLQILENLVGNAIKFTAPGGRVTVGARPGDGEVVFWVADTGPGIAAADVPHLFDRFWRARKTERRGAGLGLAIVKGLVDAHGGRLWVESEVGEGTTFYFTVPVARSE